MKLNSKIEPVPLSEKDQQRLAALLGGGREFCMLEDSEFIAQSGCPPEELENWLASAWTQHDITAVIAGEVRLGPQPHLLVRTQRNQVAARLFCPSIELLHRTAEADARAQLREALQART